MSEIDLRQVSDEALLAELGQRPELIGGAAAEAAGFDIQYVNVADEAFRNQVSRFLDPGEEMYLSDQMGVMRQFWEGLGFTDMPEPYELPDQLEGLRAALIDYPDRRAIPAPFLDLTERKSIAERARSFPASRFVMDRDALSVPPTYPIASYGRLLRDPEGVIEDPGNSYARRRSDHVHYALRYKTPEGGHVGRAEYIEAMEEAGQAARSGMRSWVFPVMDVSPEGGLRGDDPFTLYYSDGIHPASTPEAHIALQLLRQAAGEEPAFSKDVVNEAVYKVSKGGAPETLARLAIVGWYPEASTIWLDAVGVDKPDDNTGARAVFNGLSADAKPA